MTEGAGGDEAMDALRMSSMVNRIATGPHAGRTVVTLRTLPVDADARTRPPPAARRQAQNDTRAGPRHRQASRIQAKFNA